MSPLKTRPVRNIAGIFELFEHGFLHGGMTCRLPASRTSISRSCKSSEASRSSSERMADAASNGTLKKTFARHQKEIKTETERLDRMLQHHKVASDAHTDQAMEALIR